MSNPFRLVSSHTFASNTIEDQRFEYSRDAWQAAAIDYAVTDAGLDQTAQDADVATLAATFAPGTVTLSTGETISVIEHTGEPYDVLDSNGDVLESFGARSLAHAYARDWSTGADQPATIRENTDDAAPSFYESTCSKCGDVFNPESLRDVHFNRADGSECGGTGVNQGSLR